MLDDEPSAVALLTMVLKEAGYEARGATDSREAKRAAEAFKPDILVCDFHLRELADGVDAAFDLSREYPGLAIIFVTALPHEVARKAPRRRTRPS